MGLTTTADGEPKRRRRPALNGSQRVWLLAAGLAVAAAWLLGTHVWWVPPLDAPHRLPWFAFAAAFYLAEVTAIHIELRREAHSMSLSEVPFVLGLYFASPAALVGARLLGSALALTINRRQSAMKVSFNLSHFALESTLCVTVFHAIARLGDPMGPAGWIGVLAGVMIADLVATLSVAGAISLAGGKLHIEALKQLIGPGSIGTLTTAAIGLISVTIVWWHAQASWLLAFATAALYVAYRGYARLRHRQQALQLLYESTLLAQRTRDPESAMGVLLRHACEMFKGSSAQIILFGESDDVAATSITLGPDDDTVVETHHGIEADPIWRSVLLDGRPLLLTRSNAEEAAQRRLAERSIRDLIASPLRGEGGIIGGLMVANRIGDVASFTRDDLRLFETLTNHIAVSIDNAQLLDRLRRQADENRYQATHDSLTGLANRALFRNRVAHAIADARETQALLAVMLIDLDRFKEINDTLGHHLGDLVLKEVANRLVEQLGPDVTVARLGGDEFALLIPHVTRRDAQRVAERTLVLLERPIELDEMSLDIQASIGISFAPDHGEDPDTLLQRADVAMYLAKEDGGVIVYEVERDRYTPARLSLVGELRRAIEIDELRLVYQPKKELASGAITGVEALVRWDHPQRGPIYPDNFIPLAEHTGLIRPLTFWVLQEAIRQCARWRRSRPSMTVAVNLSARVIRDENLAEEIKAILDTWNVPASALVLEITESSIMADPERSIDNLRRLRAMGVTLSIDDFGTGYSSLAYLKRLPVGELKIDRAFVAGMMHDESDGVIVRSTIDLGRNLGLRVVAEGVESEKMTDLLAAMGCELVQGFSIARPLEPDEVLPWIRAQAAEPALGERAPRLRAIHTA